MIRIRASRRLDLEESQHLMSIPMTEGPAEKTSRRPKPLVGACLIAWTVAVGVWPMALLLSAALPEGGAKLLAASGVVDNFAQLGALLFCVAIPAATAITSLVLMTHYNRVTQKNLPWMILISFFIALIVSAPTAIITLLFISTGA